jgi:Flp pilus assembly protein CpaB
VLASYDPASAADAGGDGGTVVVAAGVTVVSTDRRAGTGTGRTGTAGVTLLVDPDQATALADAQANAVVTIALVPPEDAAHP